MVVSIEKAVVARLKHSGKKFEVLIDPYKALEVKKGGKVEMAEALAYPAIYKDVRSSECVAEKDLQEVFGTKDIFKIAERIVKEGELQLTTEQRREMIENKKIEIANLISRRGINPQTNSPHPPQRILAAIEKSGVKIDPFVEAEAQLEKVLKEIRAIIPISFQMITIQIKIPPQFSAKIYSILKNYGEIKSEKWLDDGSLQVSLEILGGIQDEFFQKIASLTHGQFESKIIKREGYGS